MILYSRNKFILTTFFEIKKINYIEMHIFFNEKYRTLFIMFIKMHYKNLSFKLFQIKIK